MADLKVLFLFGAGASYGSGECAHLTARRLIRPPPLGAGDKGLVAVWERTNRTELLSEIPPSLRDVFRSNFEKGMAQLITVENADRVDATNRFQVRLAEYFLKFAPTNSNLYSKLFSLLKSRNIRPVCVSLNYDVMAELAAHFAGFEVLPVLDDMNPITRHPWRGPADPTLGLPTVSFYKPHGSANYLPGSIASGKVRMFNPNFGVPLNGDGTASPGAYRRFGMVEPTACMKPEEALKLLATGNGVPVMSMYVEGKMSIASGHAIHQMMSRTTDALSKAKRIIVIGARVVKPEKVDGEPERRWHDKHLWDPVLSSGAQVHYCGDKESFGLLAQNGVKAHYLGSRFDGAMVELRTIL